MKVKELMDFNPEAEIRLFGQDGSTYEINIYGWESTDYDSSVNTKLVTKEVLIELENYKHEIEHDA